MKRYRGVELDVYKLAMIRIALRQFAQRTENRTWKQDAETLLEELQFMCEATLLEELL